MLQYCLVVILAGTAAAHVDSWPFKIADEFVGGVRKAIDALESSAATNQFLEESFNSERYETTTIEAAEEYDFIIVGGGTSGAVIANRLSEVPEWKILLLEAGGAETDATQVPRNWDLLDNTPYNWGYKTTPQNYSCLGMVDCQCAIPSGKILGGTSSINSMLYTRGNARDYDVWADSDNKGWCFSDVLPFFKKLEDVHFEHFDHKYHHQGGLQYLEYSQHLTPLADHVIEAGKELGISAVDYNGKKQVGVGIAQLTTKCGKRYGTGQAYLETCTKRKNLVIKPFSLATKLIVSTHTKDVKGVEYITENQIVTAKAAKEVIVAAGAINTAKLLLLSGIGPKDECDRLKIESVVDLKVGQNLKVRPKFIGLDLVYDEPHTTVDHNQDLVNYLKNGKGPLTSPGIEALAFLKTEASDDHVVSYPDIELQFSRKSYLDINRLKGLRLTEAQYQAVWKPLEGKGAINIAVILTHPKSTGHVTLKDSDPLHHPIIEPHLLADHDSSDFHTMLGGIHKALKIAHTETFKKLGATVNHNPVHGCEKLEFGTDEYWGCAIKHLTVSTGDASGTAKMGPESDKDAVVDNKLRVHGVNKLRIADESVIPVSITGGLTAPTIMIGEKAAHLIKEEWK